MKTKSRHIKLTTFLVLLLSLIVTTNSYAQEFTVGKLKYVIIDNDKVGVEEYIYDSNAEGVLVIPDQVTCNGTTYSVTLIGESSFRDCPVLTTVTIPSSVTEIGDYAFFNCTGLTTITIPYSATQIGKKAFHNTRWYEKQPEGVLYLDNCCLGYKEYTPKELIIKENTRLIAASAFSGCTGLTSISLPNSVMSIGGNAFHRCTGLVTVIIPDSVTEIGFGAFEDCRSLKTVNIPNSVTEIGFGAFEDCRSLKTVNISNSVTKIEDNTFLGCWGLTSVTIPNSVTKIGYSAFRDCVGLTTVTIPNSVTKIGQNAFYNTRWYEEQPEGVLYLDNCCLGYKESIPKELIIKENTRVIAAGAFSGCTGLTSVTIPNTVLSIGRMAFSGCSGLTSVTIPNSVTSIGELAFSDCLGLTSVTIPSSVTEIENYAFFNCVGLTSVIIESPYIRNLSLKKHFRGCENLKESRIIYK